MATLEDVRKELKGSLSHLESPAFLRQAASQAFTDSNKRIFVDGIKSNGSPIGQYAESTKKRKRKKFGNVSKINLRDTETLVKSYLFEERSKTKFVLGFADVSRKGIRNSELWDILEENYGDIGALTESESKNVDQVIDDGIDKLF